MPAILRRLCCAVSVMAALAGTTLAQGITAADAIQGITKHYAASLPANTVDTVKAGDASVAVTGIATTFLDTMDVLREASRRGANLIITHEPTFYNHLDDTTFFADDPVYREKLAFIEQHHMVVFRLHDVIHTPSPDPIANALIQELGWQHYQTGTDPYRFTIPKTTLLELSRWLSKQVDAKTLRVVGDPKLEVTHAAILPGAAGLQKQVVILRRDDVEVLLAGESAEWEGVEYARDASSQGRHKALILMGHEVSEEAGMKVCAEELRPLFPNLPVIHIPAGQPLWSPTNPPANSAGKK
ncbi:MAG TPA: Nif3-like dinuclear metal center hexameric protein [Candidatus Angelobacter sp.]|nr:Nif3-like dinuclear metal center hexameric protein [Candidatus Angelobacter sp.]